MKTLARRADTTRIVQRLHTLRISSTRHWGRMTAHQMVCHVSDVFRMALGQQAATPATSVLRRTLLKWIVLYAPLRWPAGTIQTNPECDQEQGGTRPADFPADVAQLEALIEQFIAGTGRHEWPVHPVFGRMSDAAWLRWGYLHTDHHLRQFGM